MKTTKRPPEKEIEVELNLPGDEELWRPTREIEPPTPWLKLEFPPESILKGYSNQKDFPEEELYRSYTPRDGPPRGVPAKLTLEGLLGWWHSKLEQLPKAKKPTKVELDGSGDGPKEWCGRRYFFQALDVTKKTT